MKKLVNFSVVLLCFFLMLGCKKDPPAVTLSLKKEDNLTAAADETVALSKGIYTLISEAYFDTGGDPKYYRQINANKEVELIKNTEVVVSKHGVERGTDFEFSKIENSFSTLGLKKGDKLTLRIELNKNTTPIEKKVSITIN
jgi:PBP1b-binding outer membrane lipoprotein LpoB